jgi:membrane protein DedA with SNARE-associated domain
VRYTDNSMDIEAVIQTSSYAGIFVLMAVNGFLSFPSSQVLYIIVGYFVGTEFLALIPAALAGSLGNTLGNVLLYEAVRARGVHYIERFKIFRPEDVRKVEAVFHKKGLWFLFVGKLLPAIKVFVPIPAGIGKVHRGAFAVIMFVASFLWSLGFIAIGYFFGKGAELWKSYGIILFIVALLVVFLFYRYMNTIAVTNASGDSENAVPPNDSAR